MRVPSVALLTAVLFGGVFFATPAAADSLFGNEALDDQFFAEQLANRGLLQNFKLQKYQALRACEDMKGGMTANDAIHSLMILGSYSFDEAAVIISSGSTAYCVGAFH